MATSEQIADLFEKLEIERSAMLATLEGISDERAGERPPEGEGEDGWSVKEQVVHLAAMDRSYRGWVRRAIAEDSPNVSDGQTPNIPLDTPFEQAHDAALASLVAQMQGEREETLELARAFTPEQFDRTASTQIFGELTVLQWLRSYYRHDRMHHSQMRGEVSDYQPNYAPGQQEPPLARD